MRIIARFSFPLFISLTIYLFPQTGLFVQEADLIQAPAIIEYDSLKIKTAGSKAGLIKFYFHRKFRVRINNNSGLEAFREISIPESFDPILYCHAPADKNAGKYLTHVNIESFQASITKSDGVASIQKCHPEITTNRTVSVRWDKYGDYERYNYTFDKLEEGDILEIDYTYSVPYLENLYSLITFRIFFHDDYPVQQKDLMFTLNKELEAEVLTYNGDDPQIETGKSTTYTWHFEDLAGCMDESGIRPYTQLPYVIFSIRPYEMIYTLPNSFVEKFVPFYVYGAAIREDKHLTIVKAMDEGVNSKQYIQLRKFIEERIKNLPVDSTGYTQLYTVHNYIADHFSFDPDTLYFDRLDTRDERFGDYLSKEVLRDRSRYNAYVGLISGLGLRYFTGYLADIRSGVISESYFEPTLTNDYLLAVLLKSGTVQFVYPKKERFGYYLNELPFYFENTTVRLIYIDDFRNWKKAINEKVLTIITPASNKKDNIRTHSASVDINVDNMSVNFNARISLSGQFSTLGRGAYLYNSADPTVNPSYSVNLWETISPHIIPDMLEIGDTEQDFPFKTNIKASFRADQSLSVQQDTFALDISTWFSNILDDNLNADHRILTYYPDFRYTDACTYQLNFNKKVKVIDRLPIVQINNSYGQLTIKFVQKLDGSILLSSRVVVGAEKVLTNKIIDVFNIQEELRKLNHLMIRFVAED